MFNLCSDQEKANVKAEILFDVFRILFEFFAFAPTFAWCAGADPGFPVGRGANLPGVPTYNFAKFSKKQTALQFCQIFQKKVVLNWEHFGP